jgi:hypothetical protein
LHRGRNDIAKAVVLLDYCRHCAIWFTLPFGKAITIGAMADGAASGERRSSEDRF